MRKTPVKKSKSKLVKKLDSIFSKYIRLKHSKKGICTCYTCGRKYEVKKIQAGHFMSRRHYSTRWDEDNVRPQCYGCNIGNQGRSYEFGLNLNKEEEGKADKLLIRSRDIVKFSTGDIEMLIAKYQNELKKLE
tara:strand:- start:94 stop:492 length:399 start_codon:yes stop_codon:yes gene_type:complete